MSQTMQTSLTLEEINREFIARFGAEYTLVCGEGNARAQLMLVGEAPGRQEEEQGRPFVGQAGKNLNEFLALAEMKRGALYISNAVKFRPTKTGASGRLSNRTPAKDEIARFNPWLAEEIACVRPRVVASLGNTALRAVLSACDADERYAKAVIGEVHGRPLSLGEGLPALFPLYHPASIIYRRELKSVYEQDVRALRAYLDNII